MCACCVYFGAKSYLPSKTIKVVQHHEKAAWNFCKFFFHRQQFFRLQLQDVLKAILWRFTFNPIQTGGFYIYIYIAYICRNAIERCSLACSLKNNANKICYRGSHTRFSHGLIFTLFFVVVVVVVFRGGGGCLCFLLVNLDQRCFSPVTRAFPILKKQQYFQTLANAYFSWISNE